MLFTPASAAALDGTNASSPAPSSSRRTRSGACAACKFQRRRCKPDCLLAPFFPADQPLLFANAHRHFGVRNLERMVEGLDPHEREAALKTLIFESEARARDPVGGCCRIIQHLEAQVERKSAELVLLRRYLAICREVAMAAGWGSDLADHGSGGVADASHGSDSGIANAGHDGKGIPNAFG